MKKNFFEITKLKKLQKLNIFKCKSNVTMKISEINERIRQSRYGDDFIDLEILMHREYYHIHDMVIYFKIKNYAEN